MRRETPMTTPGDEQRLANVLQALAVVRTFAPVEARRHERRIRFAAARVDELLRPSGAEPVRMDRVLMTSDILAAYLRRAEIFLDLISSEILVRRPA
jgi:hypothetical protein